MKLLFDHNLSPRLVERLADLHPNSTHVYLIGLDRATDVEVWAYAHANDCVIVTKDTDFNDMSVMYGSPPKVIWLRLGTCSTDEVEQVLRRAHQEIVEFAADAALGVLELL